MNNRAIMPKYTEQDVVLVPDTAWQCKGDGSIKRSRIVWIAREGIGVY